MSKLIICYYTLLVVSSTGTPSKKLAALKVHVRGGEAGIGNPLPGLNLASLTKAS